MPQDSITHWITRLKAGDRSEAVERLWSAYFTRLVSLARRHLGARPRTVVDEEDVALSAFDSFIRAAQKGRFPRLDDRDDLWQVLLVLTARKSVDQIEWAHRQKRGGGEVTQPLTGEGFEIPSGDPEPAEAAAMAEAVEQLLARLDDPQLRQVALLKLEGYRNDEIAGKLNRSVPTVDRKLARIRQQWSSFIADHP